MPPHFVTDFKIQKYHQNEQKSMVSIHEIIYLKVGGWRGHI